MKKLSITEAADYFGISKEAIYNRIRRNTLRSIEENGVRYVFIDSPNQKDSNKNPSKNQINKSNSEFVEYLIKQIDELKEINLTLQKDKDRLYEEKEQILVNTKEEIKSIYLQRDQKLQYFLELINKPLIEKNHIDGQAIDDDFDKEYTYDKENWVSFWEFLNKFNKNDIDRKKIKKFLIKNAYDNEYIKKIGDEFYVNENIDLEGII